MSNDEIIGLALKYLPDPDKVTGSSISISVPDTGGSKAKFGDHSVYESVRTNKTPKVFIVQWVKRLTPPDHNEFEWILDTIE